MRYSLDTSGSLSELLLSRRLEYGQRPEDDRDPGPGPRGVQPVDPGRELPARHGGRGGGPAAGRPGPAGRGATGGPSATSPRSGAGRGAGGGGRPPGSPAARVDDASPPNSPTPEAPRRPPPLLSPASPPPPGPR